MEYLDLDAMSSQDQGSASDQEMISQGFDLDGVSSLTSLCALVCLTPTLPSKTDPSPPPLPTRRRRTLFI